MRILYDVRYKIKGLLEETAKEGGCLLADKRNKNVYNL